MPHPAPAHAKNRRTAFGAPVLLSAHCLVHRRQGIKAGLQFLVRGHMVFHCAVVVGFVCRHIKVSRTGQAKQNGFRLAGLLAFERLVDRNADRVRGLGRGQYGLDLGELHRRIEHVGLLAETASM